MAVYTENFNQADSTTLGPNLTWAEPLGNMQTVSNQLKAVATGNHEIRAEHDTASADQYCQIVLSTLNQPASGNANAGPCVRFNAAARQFYWLRRQITSAGNVTLAIFSADAGVTTLIASSGLALSLPETLRLEVEGTALRGYVNGNLELSGTDSTWSTPTRGGVRTSAAASIENVICDDFEFGDLATFTPKIIMF